MGDFTNYLLKVDETSSVNSFSLLSNFDYHATITFPTRSSESNASLIDNIIFRLSEKPLSNFNAGNLVRRFSDDQPTFCIFNDLLSDAHDKYSSKIKSTTSFKIEDFTSELETIDFSSVLCDPPPSVILKI